MKIGVSVLTHAGQSIWENERGQHVFHFVQLLRALPFVTGIVLLNCGDQLCVAPEAQALVAGLPLVAPRELDEPPDVVFEMGDELDLEWLDYVRARGTKVVFFCSGQPYVDLIEPSVFGRSGYFSRVGHCDAIWIASSNRELAPMLRTVHRCPVYEVPFLWDSTFIEQRAGVIAEAGLRFGYEPRSAFGATASRALRVAVFEPNISVLRCCLIPMLAGEQAFRAEPAAIARLSVLNSVQMQEHPTFAFLLRSLDLNRCERVRLEGRHDFAGYMSQHADVVLTHQLHSEQGILYLEALYGGYPLVHNSPWLGNLGYDYPDSDIGAAAAQLLHIAHHHDAGHEDYVCRARDFIASLSPRAQRNTSRYARQLLALQTPASVRRPSC